MISDIVHARTPSKDALHALESLSVFTLARTSTACGNQVRYVL